MFDDQMQSDAPILAPAGSEGANEVRPRLRLAGTIAPAAGITMGLFLVMSGLINTDFIPAEHSETRVIDVFTPEEQSEEVRHRERTKPKKLEVATQPPPPAKLIATKHDISLPTPSIEGSAPTAVKIERVQSIEINPIVMDDRDATPIRPPILTYPSRAATLGIEGDCSVSFNVDVRGRPYDVEADCSDSMFRREAIRAVSKVEFAPKTVKGRAQERKNVVYPLQFKLSN